MLLLVHARYCQRHSQNCSNPHKRTVDAAFRIRCLVYRIFLGSWPSRSLLLPPKHYDATPVACCGTTGNRAERPSPRSPDVVGGGGVGFGLNPCGGWYPVSVT
jgi:hypothetical protein